MTLRFELTDGVALITLDRPEVRNAFSAAMGLALDDAYRRCDEDDDVRAVVVTGTPPAFCAGADLSRGDDTFTGPVTTGFSAAATALPAWQVRKPVIAAVNGHAVGLGLTLALQCDLRIVAADATYGVVQARRGVMGDAYSHWTLPRLVGSAVAADLLLTGRTFDGHEAVALGVANQVLPADEVLPAALATARDIAESTAPLSVAESKRLLWDSWALTPDEVVARETAAHRTLMSHPDAREGVAAFVERRRPNWTGRPSTLGEHTPARPRRPRRR